MKQMSIFDLMTDRFCFDQDINDLVSDLDCICTKHGLEHKEPKFEVWSHCPQWGYRLSYTIIVHRKTDIFDDMNAIVEKYKFRGVEISPMWGAVWFCDVDDDGRLYVYTMFTDKRQKIKQV